MDGNIDQADIERPHGEPVGLVSNVEDLRGSGASTPSLRPYQHDHVALTHAAIPLSRIPIPSAAPDEHVSNSDVLNC